jgi:hypothetical protein
LSVEPSALRWDSSDGEQRADRVILAVDARSLGALEASPAAVDALRTALARGVAEVSGRSLADLGLQWNGLAGGEVEGYRGPLPDGSPEQLRLAGALERWLEGYLGRPCGPWVVRADGAGRLRLGAADALLRAHGEEARRGLAQLTGHAVTLAEETPA